METSLRARRLSLKRENAATDLSRRKPTDAHAGFRGRAKRRERLATRTAKPHMCDVYDYAIILSHGAADGPSEAANLILPEKLERAAIHTRGARCGFAATT